MPFLPVRIVRALHGGNGPTRPDWQEADALTASILIALSPENAKANIGAGHPEGDEGGRKLRNFSLDVSSKKPFIN